MIEERPTRDGYGEALLELARTNPRVVVLDADLSRSTRTEWLAQKYPDQFINCGIAEQNMIGMAAGLAYCGLIPFATTYAIFIGRAYDQIRQALAFSQSNVKVVATHSGLAASHDGGSHQGIEDIALMRVIPEMTVLSPADYHQTRQAVFAAARHQGPVYIRLQKEPVPILTPAQAPFEIGKASLMRLGGDVALLSTGSLLADTLAAADRLALQGLAAAVVNVSTIKPLDFDLLSVVLRQTGCAVTIEEHSVYGGLHEAVLALAAAKGICLQAVAPIAILDQFGQTGEWHTLRAAYGLSSEAIFHAAMRVASSKKQSPA